jgi:hypothetical protein
MVAPIDKLAGEEIPLSPAEMLAGKVSRLLLLSLGIGVVALIPVALAARAPGLFFP